MDEHYRETEAEQMTRESNGSWPIGQVLYHYSEHLRPPAVGQLFALPNGQVVQVLTAKASDGATEKRKLTVKVVRWSRSVTDQADAGLRDREVE